MPAANPITLLITCLLLSRTWLLFIIAAASRQTGSSILEIFYPQRPLFYAGLIIGLLPLSRLILAKLWGKVSLNIQRAVIVIVVLADLALQQHIMASLHWEFHPMHALTLWCTLMMGFLLVRELLSRETREASRLIE